MSRTPTPDNELRTRRQRARRLALWVALVAVAVYVGFIVLNIPRP